MNDSTALYLDLMKRILSNFIYMDDNAWTTYPPAFDAHLRANGMDWPSQAHTMIGMKRLDNIQTCAENILQENIAGDFVETGVWRGGGCHPNAVDLESLWHYRPQRLGRGFIRWAPAP